MQSFFGANTAQFMQSMNEIASHLVSVATNFHGKEDRAFLSAEVTANKESGYLIAVRDSDDTPPEILSLAKELNDKIQAEWAKRGHVHNDKDVQRYQKIKNRSKAR